MWPESTGFTRSPGEEELLPLNKEFNVSRRHWRELVVTQWTRSPSAGCDDEGGRDPREALSVVLRWRVYEAISGHSWNIVGVCLLSKWDNFLLRVWWTNSLSPLPSPPLSFCPLPLPSLPSSSWVSLYRPGWLQTCIISASVLESGENEDTLLHLPLIFIELFCSIF